MQERTNSPQLYKHILCCIYFSVCGWVWVCVQGLERPKHGVINIFEPPAWHGCWEAKSGLSGRSATSLPDRTTSPVPGHPLDVCTVKPWSSFCSAAISPAPGVMIAWKTALLFLQRARQQFREITSSFLELRVFMEEQPELFSQGASMFPVTLSRDILLSWGAAHPPTGARLNIKCPQRRLLFQPLTPSWWICIWSVED